MHPADFADKVRKPLYIYIAGLMLSWRKGPEIWKITKLGWKKSLIWRYPRSWTTQWTWCWTKNRGRNRSWKVQLRLLPQFHNTSEKNYTQHFVSYNLSPFSRETHNIQHQTIRKLQASTFNLKHTNNVCILIHTENMIWKILIR